MTADESLELGVDKGNLSENKNYVLDRNQTDAFCVKGPGPLNKDFEPVNDHSETDEL